MNSQSASTDAVVIWHALEHFDPTYASSLDAYERGRAAKHSTTDVSSGITSTILWSTLHVLIVHFLFAFYEFE